MKIVTRSWTKIAKSGRFRRGIGIKGTRKWISDLEVIKNCFLNKFSPLHVMQMLCKRRATPTYVKITCARDVHGICMGYAWDVHDVNKFWFQTPLYDTTWSQHVCMSLSTCIDGAKWSMESRKLPSSYKSIRFLMWISCMYVLATGAHPYKVHVKHYFLGGHGMGYHMYLMVERVLH